MIRIENLTKSYDTRAGKHYLFKAVNLEIPPGKNVGILGPNGAGKSTFLRILGGIDFPDSGKIRCPYSLSWPLGIAGGFIGHLTGRENCSMVCRAYGLRGGEVGERLEFIKELSGIGKYFEEPIRYYSSGMNGRLNFSLSMAFDFEYFLIDEVTSVGDVQFREQAQEALDQKRVQSKVIMVSHSMGTIRDFCDVGIVLRDGKMWYFEDLDEALKAYFPKTKRLQKEVEADFQTDLDEFFKDALDHAPKEVQQLTNDFKASLNDLEQSLEMASEIEDEASFYHRLANLYFQMGAWTKALEYHRKAIYLEEQRLAFYPAYVTCLWQCGQKNEALEITEKVLEWDPNFHPMLSQKAQFLHQIGQLDGALKAAQELVELDSENGARWHLLATIQMAGGKSEEALQSQIKTLDLDSHNPNHWALLTRILATLGYWQRYAYSRLRMEELMEKRKKTVEQERLKGLTKQLEDLIIKIK